MKRLACIILMVYTVLLLTPAAAQAWPRGSLCSQRYDFCVPGHKIVRCSLNPYVYPCRP